VHMRNSMVPRYGAADHFRRALDWLVRFQQATSVAADTMTDDVTEEYVISPLQEFQRSSDPSLQENRMIEYTMRLASKRRSQRLPLVARQGDFWPRNLIMNGGTLGVVDWERFQPRSAPFSDLFMFPTSYGLSYPWRLGCWAEPQAAFYATYLGRNWLTRLVREYLLSYCKAMNVSPTLLEVFFPVFLVEQAQVEEKANAGKPGGARGIWRQLIRTYAEQGGSVCFG